tara:strand:+ start:48 stop:218 length:171 start_codon:yes stop_codon:yes gene_type:complete
MSDLDKFKEIVDSILEIIWGSEPKQENDIGEYIGLSRTKPSGKAPKKRYMGKGRKK